MKFLSYYLLRSLAPSELRQLCTQSVLAECCAPHFDAGADASDTMLMSFWRSAVSASVDGCSGEIAWRGVFNVRLVVQVDCQ